jgi:hypothetical protein
MKIDGNRLVHSMVRMKETKINPRKIATAKSQGCESITYSSEP